MWKSLVLATFCAGCADPSATFSASGTGSDSEQSLHCEGDVELAEYVAGAGGLSIVVHDDAGDTVYEASPGGAGEVNDTHEVDGAWGEWRIAVDGAEFAGQYKISLSCLL